MSSYAANADYHAEELRDSLSQDDIEHLRADLEQLGVDGWLDWAEKARHEANDYLRATEKQRARLKKWRDPALRSRLVLSAYHQARLAASMLDAAANLGPGGGYRDTTAYAATLGFQVMKDGEWRWPFLDIDPPKGWPGPHFEPYVTATVVMATPGQEQKPPEIRQGYDYT
jgi:hypothetical protein